MKRLILLNILLVTPMLFAQKQSFSMPVDNGNFKTELSRFVANNETIFEYLVSDITGDKIPDIIAITSPDDQQENRTIYLIQGLGGNKFEISTSSKNIIECPKCGGAGVGDPYQGVDVINGNLTIYLMYGSCTKDSFTTTFKYNQKKKDWFLFKDINTIAYCNETDPDGSVKVRTRKNRRKEYGKLSFSDYQL